MRVLGIDPGYAIVGYGALEYDSGRYRVVEHGAITTPADADFNSRLDMIYSDMESLMTSLRPDAMAIEQLFFTSNQKTVIAVAEARGVILLSARRHGVEIYEYTPLQVKQSIVGYGRAEKHQVMEMTKTLLGLKKVPKPDDAADALALAICHAHTQGSILGKYTEGK